MAIIVEYQPEKTNKFDKKVKLLLLVVLPFIAGAVVGMQITLMILHLLHKI